MCRDAQASQTAFGITDGTTGIIYTRTGRRFFEDTAVEDALLARVRQAAEDSGLFEELQSNWLCLDCELMPWSAKAQSLLRSQYAAVGAAALAVLPQASALLKQAELRGLDLTSLREQQESRLQNAKDYVAAYRRYCWPVNSVEDLQIAPFHLLASAGTCHVDQTNT